MNFTNHATLGPVKKHDQTLIFLHGLGGTGEEMKEVFQDIEPLYQNCKIIFPTAKTIKVTAGGGQCPGWYDIEYNMDERP